MMLFYSETKKIKYFLDPPPKKAQGYGRDMAPSTCVCLYQQPVTWSFTWSRLSDSEQSNPFIRNYYLIIVAFSGPHFSIYDIFYTKESTLSFNERDTHFNRKVKISLQQERKRSFYVLTLSFLVFFLGSYCNR